MKIAQLVLTRIGTALFALLIVSAIVFFGNELGGGDAASTLLGQESTREDVYVWRQKFGLDRPVLVRYVAWLGGLVRGDLGNSMTFAQTPLSKLIGFRVKNTLYLGAAAFAIYLPLTLALAVISAVYRYRWPDHLISAFTLAKLGIPPFVAGPGLLILFVLIFPLIPAVQFLERADTPLDYVKIFVLPATTLALGMTGYATRMLRENLIEVLDSDYVLMANFKGLPLWRVIFLHALPNAIIPSLNVTAANLPLLLGGSVIVELVFAYPGMGHLIYQAVNSRDAPMMEIGIMLAAGAYVVANLLADLLSVLLVPKLRTA